MALYFKRDPQTGISGADSEWQRLWQTHSKELTEIFVYLAYVDRGGPPPGNIALAQATSVRPHSPAGSLYWWQSNGVAAYFIFDGTDTVIVMLTTVADPQLGPIEAQCAAEERL